MKISVRAECRPELTASTNGELAEIAEGLAAEYPAHHADLAGFETGNADDLREKLRRLLALSGEERAVLSGLARKAVVERWSWAGVAGRLLGHFN